MAALIVLAVSFVGLAVLWSRPKLEQPVARELPRALCGVLLSRPRAVVCGAIGVFLLGVTVWAGLRGWLVSVAYLVPVVGFLEWLGLANYKGAPNACGGRLRTSWV